MPKRSKSSYRNREREREPRINERIRAHELRVLIGENDSRIMSRKDALEMARSRGEDLVEISPEQKPPVCKITDYGKFRFEQKKIKKMHTKKQQVITLKEVKIGAKIAQHDYDLKKRNILAFLAEGNKVKVSLRFRGREIVHPEIGEALMTKLVTEMQEACQVENPLKREGRQLLLVLGPKGSSRKKPKSNRVNKKQENAAGVNEASTVQKKIKEASPAVES